MVVYPNILWKKCCYICKLQNNGKITHLLYRQCFYLRFSYIYINFSVLRACHCVVVYHMHCFLLTNLLEHLCTPVPHPVPHPGNQNKLHFHFQCTELHLYCCSTAHNFSNTMSRTCKKIIFQYLQVVPTSIYCKG